MREGERESNVKTLWLSCAKDVCFLVFTPDAEVKADGKRALLRKAKKLEVA